MELTHQETTVPLLEDLTIRVLRHAQRLLGPATLAALIANNLRPHNITQALDQALTLIQERNTLPSAIPTQDGGTRTEPAPVSQTTTQANSILQSHLLDPDTMARLPLAARPPLETFIHRNNQPTLRQYNSPRLNPQIVGGLLDSSPRVIQHHTQCIAPRHRQPRKYSHPGQVVTAVRRDLELTPAQWRWFCRTDLRVYPGGPDTWEAVRLGCLALAAANVPQAEPVMLQQVFNLTYQHQVFLQTEPPPPPGPNPWKAWIALLSSYLREGDHRGQAQLHLVTDALTGHINDGLPWGPGNWLTLLERGYRWHRERTRTASREALESRWESLLTAQAMGDITATPVTTGEDLHRLGQEMNNCIGSYWKPCQEGHTRVFALHQGEKLLAAVEINRFRQTWTPGQAEAPGHIDPDPRTPGIARLLANRYQERQDRADARN